MDQGPPPDMGPPPQKAGDILEQMLVLAKQYDDLENDPESQAAVAKMLADIRALQARHQKIIDQATGTSPATQMMRRNGG
jgi:hypothetical protein